MIWIWISKKSAEFTIFPGAIWWNHQFFWDYPMVAPSHCASVTELTDSFALQVSTHWHGPNALHLPTSGDQSPIIPGVIRVGNVNCIRKHYLVRRKPTPKKQNNGTCISPQRLIPKIGWKGNLRTLPYFCGKTCRFSLTPIHWVILSAGQRAAVGGWATD